MAFTDKYWIPRILEDTKYQNESGVIAPQFTVCYYKRLLTGSLYIAFSLPFHFLDNCYWFLWDAELHHIWIMWKFGGRELLATGQDAFLFYAIDIIDILCTYYWNICF